MLPTVEPHLEPASGVSAVEVVLEGRPSQVGSLTVARRLRAVRRRSVGPFVFLDRMGPARLAPGEGFDVKPHPHIGLSTVTYLFAGENVHRDSLGSVQVNRPGDLNVMTAGRGIAHSERAEPSWKERGGVLDGMQLWLGVPQAHEEDAPSFESYAARTLPSVEPVVGVRGCVALGAAWGARSPATHISAPLLVDLEVQAGVVCALPALAAEQAVFVAAGSIELEAQRLDVNRLAVLRRGAEVRLRADGPARLLVLGGPALDGPRYLDWNFVSSRKERLAEAVRDWKERRFPPIPGDDLEHVPYPDRPGRSSPKG